MARDQFISILPMSPDDSKGSKYRPPKLSPETLALFDLPQNYSGGPQETVLILDDQAFSEQEALDYLQTQGFSDREATKYIDVLKYSRTRCGWPDHYSFHGYDRYYRLAREALPYPAWRDAIIAAALAG